MILNSVFVVLIRAALALHPPTNLPPAQEGVFTVFGSSIINADVDAAWNLLTNFSDYPNWNPFARSQVIVNEWGVELSDQTPFEGAILKITTQIPALTPPVNASTPSDPLNTHITREIVSTVQPELHRAAWYLDSPKAVLDAERWLALSKFIDDDGGAKTFFETREVYNGSLARAVQELLEDDLNQAFQAQADAMRITLEKY
ncbi:hypothetical protein CYLTODRAFT_422229 [Cylindrobasidium torrendii FP15055 ss-10]|uniref:Coenzyme Q-binding protein COQ10 START domain-containing protein n=1 Tax=Cylindrobasidium torrendii FP15055 ss-10 TaxID=1314674 RepID=A0A0D7BDW6_9AGAR|nr:hypothetical protein CYLTODRAFT_422229 [Cylindrobasidium torrendii FP15055 ss-10]